MRICDLIEVSARLREATRRRQEVIAYLQTKLRITKGHEITDKEFIDFAYRVRDDKKLVTAFNEIADGKVKIVIVDRPVLKDKISIKEDGSHLIEDGSLLIHHNISPEGIRSFLELTPAKASA